MEKIAFTLTLSAKDWDQDYGGWRCGALKIPGAKVENVYVAGRRPDANQYEVLPEDGYIRWHDPQHAPQQVAVSLRLKEELSTKELTLRWKKLAVLLPVLASIIAAAITASVTYSTSSRQPSSPLPSTSPVRSSLLETVKDALSSPTPTPTLLPKESPVMSPSPIATAVPPKTSIDQAPFPKIVPTITPTAKPSRLIADVLITALDQYGEKYPDIRLTLSGQGIKTRNGTTHKETGAFKFVGCPCGSTLTISQAVRGVVGYSEDFILDCSKVNDRDFVFPKTIRLAR